MDLKQEFSSYIDVLTRMAQSLEKVRPSELDLSSLNKIIGRMEAIRDALPEVGITITPKS